jgi:membrane protein
VAARVPILRMPVAVQKRFGALKGGSLAAAVTLQSFLALFPLLLALVAIVGFFSAHSSTDVAGRIIGEFGLTGDAATAMRDALSTAEESRRTASVVGLVGLAWSGLGLVAALQYAYDQVWQVESRGVKDKAVGVMWLVGAALLFVGGAAITTVLRWVPGFVTPVGALASIGISFLLWWWTSKALPNRDVGWRPLIPGAIAGAVGLEILKVVGAYYVPKAVSSSSELYGSIGIVFAILAWLLLFTRLVVYSEILNVVLWERRVGTQRALIEVPRGVLSDQTPEVSRTGTMEADEVSA